jgi:hypothetical protein
LTIPASQLLTGDRRSPRPWARIMIDTCGREHPERVPGNRTERPVRALRRDRALITQREQERVGYRGSCRFRAASGRRNGLGRHAQIVRLRAPWLTAAISWKPTRDDSRQRDQRASRTGPHPLQRVAGPVCSACESGPGKPAADGRVFGRLRRWNRSHWPDGADRQRRGDLG